MFSGLHRYLCIISAADADCKLFFCSFGDFSREAVRRLSCKSRFQFARVISSSHPLIPEHPFFSVASWNLSLQTRMLPLQKLLESGIHLTKGYCSMAMYPIAQILRGEQTRENARKSHPADFSGRFPCPGTLIRTIRRMRGASGSSPGNPASARRMRVGRLPHRRRDRRRRCPCLSSPRRARRDRAAAP